VRVSRTALLAGIAVLFAASVGLALAWLVAGSDRERPDDLDAARTEALDAARRTATDINSYDYRVIDKQFDVVQREVTGSVLENFEKTKTSVRAGFVSSKISSTAQVLAAGTISASQHDSTVLVWLTVNTTSADKPSVQQAPLRIHLVRQNSTWLVDQIATVG
jgi:Mce-associated membrane protein